MPYPSEVAYSHLKKAILDLQFKPGEPIRTQGIASLLGLSRTPIREALNRLEQEGLVLRNEGRGYVVRTISIKQAMDIYDMREVLEVDAVRRAAKSITKKELKVLSAILKRAEVCLAQGRLKECRDQNRAFNLLIARACGNECLEEILSPLADRTRWLGSMITDRYTTRPRESLRDHRKILDALEAGDPDAAEDATRDLIAGARKSFTEYVISAKPRDLETFGYRTALTTREI